MRTRLYFSIFMLVIYSALLVELIRCNMFEMNGDLVAYVQLARYYTQGNFSLAVSGYWGPLSSWLLVPLVAHVDHPLHAVRALLVFEALIFVLGAAFLIQQLDLPPWPTRLLPCLVAILTFPIFIYTIVLPDVLLSGILFFATGLNLSDSWTRKRSTQLATGVLYAMAYLAKSVGLPLGIFFLSSVAVFEIVARNRPWKHALRSYLWTLAGIVLIAGSWVGVLSYKYGRLEFSTVARAAHALHNPERSDLNLFRHPSFSTFHIPERGRLTSWEDPSYMTYNSWSPLQSRAYALHQLEIIFSNIRNHPIIWLFSVSLIVLILLVIQRGTPPTKCMWLGTFALGNALAYLPTFALDPRYFLPATVFLVVAIHGVWWKRNTARISKPLVRYSVSALRYTVLGYIFLFLPFQTISFLPGFFERDRYQKLRSSHEAIIAQELAKELHARGFRGPIAGGDPVGLYVAFLLQQPWHGYQQPTNIDSILDSKADLFFVDEDVSNRKLIEQLNNDPRFEDLRPLVKHTREGLKNISLGLYLITREHGE
jgi:hypothetical protein